MVSASLTHPTARWFKRPDVKRALVLDEPTDMAAVQRVIAVGYAPDLTDVAIWRSGGTRSWLQRAFRDRDAWW